MKIQKEKIDILSGAVINYEADAQDHQDETHNTFSLTFEAWISEWKEATNVKTFKFKDFTKRNYYECTEIAFQQAAINPDDKNWIECEASEIDKHNAQPLWKEYVNVSGECIQVAKFGWL